MVARDEEACSSTIFAETPVKTSENSMEIRAPSIIDLDEWFNELNHKIRMLMIEYNGDRFKLALAVISTSVRQIHN